MLSPDKSSLHDYWQNFYAGRESSYVPEVPSAFAEWVRDRLEPADRVVEIGFGTGRDSLWFARNGHAVHGYDFAESAVEHARDRATHEELDATFGVLDLYDRSAVEAVASTLARLDGPRVLYGRFLVHSLTEEGRLNLWDLARLALRDGGETYLEFRTGKDQNSEHLFGDDHYRVYLNPELVAAEIESRDGTVLSLDQGHGLAVYKSEDPHVARIVARWT